MSISLINSFVKAPYVAPPGEVVFTANATWTCPPGVTSVSVVAVGGGGGGGAFEGGGGGGGGLGWKNNIPVTPGQTYTVVVGSGGQVATVPDWDYMLNPPVTNIPGGDSYFISPTTVKGGGGSNGQGTEWWITGFGVPFVRAGGGGGSYYGDGGGLGGTGGSDIVLNASIGSAGGGGAGAGGYRGNGGNGGSGHWQLNSGTVGQAGTGGAGGGAGGGSGTMENGNGTTGGAGGGGVGVFGQGSNGIAGSAFLYTWKGFTWKIGIPGGGGSNGSTGFDPEIKAYIPWEGSQGGGGGNFGGGGGGAEGFVNGGDGHKSNVNGGPGGPGAVRIIWGSGRSFPSDAA